MRARSAARRRARASRRGGPPSATGALRLLAGDYGAARLRGCVPKGHPPGRGGGGGEDVAGGAPGGSEAVAARKPRRVELEQLLPGGDDDPALLTVDAQHVLAQQQGMAAVQRLHRQGARLVGLAEPDLFHPTDVAFGGLDQEAVRVLKLLDGLRNRGHALLLPVTANRTPGYRGAVWNPADRKGLTSSRRAKEGRCATRLRQQPRGRASACFSSSTWWPAELSPPPI